MVYVFLADGFEELEALAPVDVLRRCGAKVLTVSVTDSKEVKGTHGITVLADVCGKHTNFDDAEAVILPGGLPGADNLENSEIVKKAVLDADKKGKIVAAICAAPKALGKFGILKGKRATCYPGFENELIGAEKADERVCVCENVITGCGAGAALEFSFEIAKKIGFSAEAEKVYKGMLAQ